MNIDFKNTSPAATEKVITWLMTVCIPVPKNPLYSPTIQEFIAKIKAVFTGFDYVMCADGVRRAVHKVNCNCRDCVRNRAILETWHEAERRGEGL